MSPVEEATLPGALLRLPRLSTAEIHPWIGAFVALHAFALVSAFAAAWYLKARLDSISSSVTVISRQAADLTEKTAALGEESRAIKAEGAELRQYIASSSAEQVVFLKILVLK